LSVKKSDADGIHSYVNTFVAEGLVDLVNLSYEWRAWRKDKMTDVPENRRPLIHAMGQLFWIGQADKERLEDRKIIGRTGRRYRGNSASYDQMSAQPRGGCVIQAQAGPCDVIAWVDTHLEVEGHFLATNEEE